VAFSSKECQINFIGGFMSNMKRILSVMVLILTAILMAVTVHAGKKITIADMNWPSAEFMGHLDKVILEKGYGFEVEMVAGSTLPTFTSMNEKGTPDLLSELWTNAVVNQLKKAVEEGRLHVTNTEPITGVGEAFWLDPKTAKAHPELKTVEDVFEHPELFPHPEDPSKGAILSCPAGWACQLVCANLFRAFNLEKKGWILVDPGSAAGLDGSIAKAVERGESWFGYYWAPTALVGKYKLVSLPFKTPFIGNEHWDSCIVKPEQECADPQPSSWRKPGVYTIVADNYKKTGGPEAMTYLQKRTLPLDVLNGILVYMTDNQADGNDAAYEFLLKHEDLWTQWVTTDAAKKIKKAVK